VTGICPSSPSICTSDRSVPYPDESDEKIQRKLAGVGVKYLIVDEPNKFRLPTFTCIPISDQGTLLSLVQDI
jgi:hypothetical protein